MHFYLSLDRINDKNWLNDSAGLQVQVFQLFAGKVCRILDFEWQDYLDRWVLFSGRYWLRVFNFRGNKRPDCSVDKVLWIFQPREYCPQTVTFYTLIHLHERAAKLTKQSSSIGKHFINEHCIVPKDLNRHFPFSRSA